MAAAILRMYGRVLRAEREAAGISQEDLAHEAGIHRTYVSMLERGLANPSLTVLASIAEALGTTLSAMFQSVERKRG